VCLFFKRHCMALLKSQNKRNKPQKEKEKRH